MDALLVGLTLACHLCLPSDTPPRRVLPAPVIGTLLSQEDVVGASRMPDGAAAPRTLVLPTLRNRAELVSYIAGHYPKTARRTSAMPVLWVYVDDQGVAFPYRVITSAGDAALDSLAVVVTRRARFAPALLGKSNVAVWVPLPVQLRMGPEQKPTFTPYTTKPELQNRDEVRVALARHYPPALRDRGQGGAALMWLFLNARGEVEQVRLKDSSGFPELDAAAEQVARVMRFSPALQHGEPVPVWIQLPIVFKGAQR